MGLANQLQGVYHSKRYAITPLLIAAATPVLHDLSTLFFSRLMHALERFYAHYITPPADTHIPDHAIIRGNHQ